MPLETGKFWRIGQNLVEISAIILVVFYCCLGTHIGAIMWKCCHTQSRKYQQRRIEP